jgi:uncharacterized membrane protein
LIKRLKAERGAVAVLTAASMLMVMSAVALSVDIGDITWRQRQIQGVVDLASMDAVRALSDRRDSSQTRCAQALTYARQSAARNNFDYSLSGFSLSVQLGTENQTTKTWSMLSDCTSNLDPSTANAVKVTASRPVLFRFLPGSDNVLGNAIATMDPKADIAMGTWLARVTMNLPSDWQSLDRFMYCMGKGGGTTCGSSTTGVTLVGYQGLAAATINYGSLFSQLNLGTNSALANTQVSYKTFLLAAATVMSSKGDAVSATALNSLAATADATLKFRFGDFLDVSNETYPATAALNVNLLDLIGSAAEATAQVSNSNHFLELDLPITVAGASVHVKASLIEAPVHAYGPARQDSNGNWVTNVHTAQVRMKLTLTLTNVNLGLVTTSLAIPVYVESAAGNGSLTNITCASNLNNSSVTVHATTSAVKVYVGQVTDGALTNTSVSPTITSGTMAQVSILGIPVTIAAGGPNKYVSLVNATKDAVLTGAFTRFDTVGSTSPSTSTLSSNAGVTVTAAGLSASILNTLLSNVNTAVAPVLNAVGSQLLQVIGNLPIGLQFAGADIWNDKVDCAGRRLVG